MYFFMIINLDGIKLNKILKYLVSTFYLKYLFNILWGQLPHIKWWDIWYFFHIKVLCLKFYLYYKKYISRKKLFRYISLHCTTVYGDSRPPSYVWVSDNKTKNNKKVILSTTYLFTVYNYELTVRRILLGIRFMIFFLHYIQYYI